MAVLGARLFLKINQGSTERRLYNNFYFVLRLFVCLYNLSKSITTFQMLTMHWQEVDSVDVVLCMFKEML